MGVLAYFEKFINEHGSSAILRDRIVLMEQQHHAEKQKLKAEQDALAEQFRMVTSERDHARRELHLTKSELEKAMIRIFHMEPLAVKAREMAITVGFRKAFFGSGYVLTLQNKTIKTLALNVTVTDATRQRNMQFRVVANGGSAMGASFTAAPPKEIGHAEGWAFASGDNIEVVCAGFDPLHTTVP